MVLSSRDFSTEIELRFADLDAYGHVNNATYFTFLETARVKVFNDNFVDFMNEGIFFVVSHAECDYKKPIKLKDRVFIDFSIPAFGRVSFDILYQIHNGQGLVFSTAKTTMVCIDAQSHKTKTIPDKVIQSMT